MTKQKNTKQISSKKENAYPCPGRFYYMADSDIMIKSQDQPSHNQPGQPKSVSFLCNNRTMTF